jgi:pimeloyl-ACP methyl ester carboxylesterase
MSAAPPPLLVLLPGMDGTGIMFEPFLEVLKGFQARVVRYPAALTTYAECAAFARTQLPVDRPFLLLGESFSGPVAIALAAERPAGLLGLVLCSTFARNPRPNLAWAAPLLRLLPPMRLPLPLLRRLLLGGRAPEALTRLVTTMLPQVPSGTLKHRLLEVVAGDHTALLAQIQVPILALVATQDRLVSRAATDWIRTHRLQLDILTLNGPHWLLQTRPRPCLEGIQAFCARNEPAATGSPAGR